MAQKPLVSIEAWVLKELLFYAKPALARDCDELGKAGHAASEQRQNEVAAVTLAEACLVGVDTTSPTPAG